MAKHEGQWKAGQSGNPKGRPPGANSMTNLRKQIAEHLPAIIEKQIELALEGDRLAARLLIERVLPPVKAVEPVHPFTMPDGSLSDQGRHVMRLMADGELATSQGAQLLTALGTMAKVKEVDELERRLSALEDKRGS